jgi:predicted metalloprotease
MKLDDLRDSDNVEDRRGGGGGPGLGGLALGGGGLGAVAIAVIYMLLGGNPADLMSQQSAPAPASAPGAPRADDAALTFASKVLGSTEDVWTRQFADRGMKYEPTTLVPYDQSTSTGCGAGEAAMGPFYCPSDNRVYIDLAFFNELKTRFGAPGDFAQAYVIAHEVGHHVQQLLGATDKVEQLRAEGGDPKRLSVKVELQADCYAGVWANQAGAMQHIIEPGDIDEGLAAANAVGDDTLQKETQGRVVPDSFTHGSSAQRMRWFKTGYESGKIESCDTFGAGEL